MDSTIGAAITGLFGTVVALAVVLGLAWLTLKGLRQWQDRGLGARTGEVDHPLRFVRALPVGQRERLMLVEAKGELMLVGVTAGSVTLLRNWGATPMVDGTEGSPDGANGTNGAVADETGRTA